MDLNIFGKKEDKVEEKTSDEESEPVGKYTEPCSLCGKAPTDKHWAGQYFHKKCLRKMRKMGKGML